ncbi:MAG: EAL domain-containing protein, partial [Pseudomonadota bacterium]
VEQRSPALHVSNSAILVTSPLVAGNSSNGSVIIRFENPDFWEVAKPIVVANLSSSVPILLLGILLASMLARQITGPLSRLAASATEIANGNLDVKVPVEGPNEIKGLGRAVSAMIQTLKDNIDQIYQLAYVDRTTQLPNREYFRNELTRAIRRCVRQQSTGALLFVDLDGFKRVNDTHGHDAGDVLLGQFSDRLANVLRAEDLIGFDSFSSKETDGLEAGSNDEINDKKKRQVLARLGGDEFTVLLSDIREATDAATVSKRIIAAVSEPFELDGTRVNIGASIGIAAFPQDGSDYQTILKSADMAMYQAKEEGKNTYRFFSAELNEAALRRVEIEADLRVALEAGNQLELYYQPKIDCATGLPNSAEALIRWNHPEKGMIQPLEFINIAEDCGLILPLGRWILEEACSQIVKFREAGINISVGVNISTAQFERPDLARIIREVLTQTGAPPSSLELELTESMAMQNPDVALKQVASLKELGVRFAIDDFGTGYSNLSQLSRLPFDVFKIDRSIVDLIANTDDEHGRVIVRTILAMANSLDYETVAEGVETEEQYAFLTHHGCTSVQGYFFARPLPVRDFVDWYSGWANCENLLPVNKSKKSA